LAGQGGDSSWQQTQEKVKKSIGQLVDRERSEALLPELIAESRQLNAQC
jgi:hypothetical protein